MKTIYVKTPHVADWKFWLYRILQQLDLDTIETEKFYKFTLPYDGEGAFEDAEALFRVWFSQNTEDSYILFFTTSLDNFEISHWFTICIISDEATETSCLPTDVWYDVEESGTVKFNV